MRSFPFPLRLLHAFMSYHHFCRFDRDRDACTVTYSEAAYRLQEKEYRRLGFVLATERYQELQPSLERLNDLATEQVG